MIERLPFDAKQISNRMLTGFARISNRQARGALVTTSTTETGRKKVDTACALGALALGYGIKPNELEKTGQWWPENIEDPMLTAPCGYGGSTSSTIVHLNDAHGWSVDDIAAFLVNPDSNFEPKETGVFASNKSWERCEYEDDYLDDEDRDADEDDY